MSESLKKILESIPSSVLKSSPYPIQWIGLREVIETSSTRYFRDAKPQMIHQNKTHGIMVEVLLEGQFGYSATPKTDIESVTQAILLAKSQALQSARRGIFRFTTEQRPKVLGHYSTPIQKAFDSMSPQEINAVLVQICEKLKKSPKISRTEAWVESLQTQTHFVSSNGSDFIQNHAFMMTGFRATAQDSGDIQKRTFDRNLQGGIEFFHTPDLWSQVEKTSEEALELLLSENCPTEEMDLVLTPDQMMLQIHESIGHPLELDRILGDERNYAGWSFVKPEDFGKLQYGSSLMNITFDPTLSTELASYAFDDTGNPSKKEYLIQNGKLIRGLGSLESQIRSQIAGVANARATSWNRSPIDRMANLNLEPGQSTFEEIISSVERGVLMETNRSWSIDDFRNKFQFGCEYAKLIENGKITRTLKNPNYRGISVPFWNKLKKVGNLDTFELHGTPNCGKGEPNQVIRVGHASPVCLFDHIEVFGGTA